MLARLLMEYCVHAALMAVTNLMSSCGAINWETNQIWNGVTTDKGLYLAVAFKGLNIQTFYLVVNGRVVWPAKVVKRVFHSLLLEQWTC
jgi:hypothetical protein